MDKKRARFQDIAELASLIRITDGTFIEVLAKRGELAGLVGDYKDLKSQNKIRKDVETKRLNEFSKHAEHLGVDPNYARAMLHHAISESCRIQMTQTDNGHIAQLQWIDSDRDKWREHLKQNLIKLTEFVAPIYETDLYGSNASVATTMYLDYEWIQIQHEIENLRAHNALDLALDLGCATGRITRKLSKTFKKVIGCDLSSHMLQVAKSYEHSNGHEKIDYFEMDMENGLQQIPSNSVNLVVMTVGTASDIYDLRRVLASINRVLTSNGRFVLSFYNKSALMYNMFVPWPLSLQAKANIEKKYLEVTIDGNTFPIFAQLYDAGTVKRQLKKAGFITSRILTYPTIGSILPCSVLKQDSKDLAVMLKNIDQRLSGETMGAYIIATGCKSGLLTKK